MLKQKSKAAGLSANKWLMSQLKANRPLLHRKTEVKEVVDFINEVGREINAIARDFNSGYGTTQQLQYAVQQLAEVHERMYALRMMGYPYAE